MSTDPSQPGDDTGPELQSLEADESIPPRPEEEAANAVHLPHRDSEQRTHPDDVVGPFSALTEESEPVRYGAGDGAGDSGSFSRPSSSSASQDSDDGGAVDSQPYPPSPAPGDVGPESATAHSSDPYYEPPDYPEDVYDGPAEG